MHPNVFVIFEVQKGTEPLVGRKRRKVKLKQKNKGLEIYVTAHAHMTECWDGKARESVEFWAPASSPAEAVTSRAPEHSRTFDYNHFQLYACMDSSISRIIVQLTTLISKVTLSSCFFSNHLTHNFIISLNIQMTLILNKWIILVLFIDNLTRKNKVTNAILPPCDSCRAKKVVLGKKFPYYLKTSKDINCVL